MIYPDYEKKMAAEAIYQQVSSRNARNSLSADVCDTACGPTPRQTVFSRVTYNVSDLHEVVNYLDSIVTRIVGPVPVDPEKGETAGMRSDSIHDRLISDCERMEMLLRRARCAISALDNLTN